MTKLNFKWNHSFIYMKCTPLVNCCSFNLSHTCTVTFRFTSTCLKYKKQCSKVENVQTIPGHLSYKALINTTGLYDTQCTSFHHPSTSLESPLVVSKVRDQSEDSGINCIHFFLLLPLNFGASLRVD